ncbi:MAG: ribonuclease D [Chloroflexi bacterium]|nr:ribonuclease D [Chloroflexota bacterium]
MTVLSLAPPILITDSSGLTALAYELAEEPAIAVDTESNSLFAYKERVCLIQFSTQERDYVVDPLILSDLNELGPLFANPRQQKVFHAADYDLLCLKRDYGFKFANLFDTKIAASTMGWPQMGLAAILETHFGVKMNKRYQRTNWGQRPLTVDQLDYARLDTHYLLALRSLLEAKLTAQGRVEEACEAFALLTRVTGDSQPEGNDRFWRVNGARDLTPMQASILREVYLYREEQASRADRPPFKVMNEKTILEIAQRLPKRLSDLREVTGMTPGQIHRYGGELLLAVQRGLMAPAPPPPQYERVPDEVRERYDHLHQWRKQIAHTRGVQSDVILPREVLWELARRAPRTLTELETIEHLGPWRRHAYGADILRVLTESGRSSNPA